ncbi:MAG: ASPIC/UnbV domain-containing protein [Phycisphaerae bacterium]
MASQSPTTQPVQPTEKPARDYENGWAALTKLMHEGYSWSGYEHNCAYLNLGDGRFADISAAAGLDYIDDGRSLAVTDWDGDGDLDVWLKNRTGPQVRFLRNDNRPSNHFIALKLRGRTCNRDAIGATVVVESGGRRLVRTLLAGDGYLAQSSKWLHFGLGSHNTVDQITITWPDGKNQILDHPEADRRYRVVQEGTLPETTTSSIVSHTSEPDRSIRLKRSPADKPHDVGSARVVLKVPLPLPPTLVSNLFGESAGSGRARLVSLWAEWCAPCKGELIQFAQHNERLHDAGLDIQALNVDKEADRAKARAWFNSKVIVPQGNPALEQRSALPNELNAIDAILRHARDNQADWPLPTSLLLNPHGTVQIIYLGPIGVDRLMSDTREYGLSSPPLHLRASFPGRWYFRTPRNLPALARDLRERGLGDEARFYAILDRAIRPQSHKNP